MATIYFVKDGPRPDNSGWGWTIDLSELKQTLPDIDVIFYGEDPPEIDKELPSKYPEHVFIEINQDEEDGGRFEHHGFYYLKDIKPDDPRITGISKELSI